GRKAMVVEYPNMIWKGEDICVVQKPADWICSASDVDKKKGRKLDPNEDLRNKGFKVMKDLLDYKFAEREKKYIHWWIQLMHETNREEFPNLFDVDQNYGLCHRLDRETSGTVLVGITKKSRTQMRECFHRHYVRKLYVCLVHGFIDKAEQTVDRNLEAMGQKAKLDRRGKRARTHVKVLGYFTRTHKSGRVDQFTLCTCEIAEGRMHQIRLHMAAALGSPIVSEFYYQKAKQMIEDRRWCQRVFLHAYAVGFPDMGATNDDDEEEEGNCEEDDEEKLRVEDTEQEWHCCICPLTNELRKVLKDLKPTKCQLKGIQAETMLQSCLDSGLINPNHKEVHCKGTVQRGQLIDEIYFPWSSKVNPIAVGDLAKVRADASQRQKQQAMILQQQEERLEKQKNERPGRSFSREAHRENGPGPLVLRPKAKARGRCSVSPRRKRGVSVGNKRSRLGRRLRSPGAVPPRDRSAEPSLSPSDTVNNPVPPRQVRRVRSRSGRVVRRRSQSIRRRLPGPPPPAPSPGRRSSSVLRRRGKRRKPDGLSPEKGGRSPQKRGQGRLEPWQVELCLKAEAGHDNFRSPISQPPEARQLAELKLSGKEDPCAVYTREHDAWEAFLEKTDPRKRVEKKFEKYTWSFGIDEDDEGFTRDCVILEVAATRETEPRHVQAKLTSKHLRLTLHGDLIIDDDFSDERWLSVEDSYWELETKTNKSGERIKNIRYLLYLRNDCTKYITKTLFEQERQDSCEDSDDDTADARIKMIANLKEPEPRREVRPRSMDPALLSALGALFGHATGESTESTGDAPSASIAILTVPGRGIVGTAITPNGARRGQDGAFPLPMGLLQNLGGQVSRVPLGSQEEAAATLGGIMSMMMEQMTRVAMQQSMEENSRKVPPASERVRDALPRIVVTKEDLMDSTNSKCSICLDDFQPGFRATRMLCSHLFCNNCIREWLREANSCPVCRYELATDCEEFEAGRRARMENRPVRLKLAELQQLRVTELKRLMKALQVSPDGCLEKAELVRRLQGASDVVLEEENAQRYSKEELEDLPLLLLRNLLERHQVPNRMSFSGEESPKTRSAPGPWRPSRRRVGSMRRRSRRRAEPTEWRPGKR
ncbi:E3 ubiquitin-protein ligase RING1 (RING finger protein 1) (RING-type E3 ubiquitin transferase RING1), partial [Durusdinium trenchii]